MVFILLLFFLQVFAAETETRDQQDISGKMIASEWRLFNRNVDTFFSNQKYLSGDNKSSIFVYSSFYKKEGGKIENDFDLQMRFDLPHTTKKLKIVVEKEQNEIRKALSNENVSRSQKNTKIASEYTRTAETKYAAGADYLLPKLKNFTGMLKFGIRLDMPINPFVKLNLQKDFKTKFIEINFSQNFILYRQAGFQEITQLAFNKQLNEDFHFELLNSLVWTDEKDVFDLRNSVSLYQNLGKEKGLSYVVGANAKLSPVFYYDSYDASLSYRQLVYSNWMYASFTVGADFPKSSGFDDEKFVQLRAEMFFR